METNIELSALVHKHKHCKGFFVLSKLTLDQFGPCMLIVMIARRYTNRYTSKILISEDQGTGYHPGLAIGCEACILDSPMTWSEERSCSRILQLPRRLGD